MFGQNNYATVNSRINRLAAERGVLVAAHRGTATGTVVENTLLAARAAVRSGATIIEVDVVASTDGDHFLFHDGLELHRLGMMQNINSMSSAQIRSAVYVEQNSTVFTPRVEEVSALLEHFRGQDVLFNVDRSWWYWDTLLPELDSYDMADQLVIKSNVDDESLDRLRAHAVKYPYMPMVRSMADIDKVLGDEQINLIGVELLADNPGHPFVDATTISALQDKGLMVLLNAINLNNRVPLFAGYDDEVSLFEDPAAGWGKLVDLGADVIQTDWTALLHTYLREINASTLPQA